MFDLLRDTLMKLNGEDASRIPQDELMSAFKDVSEEHLKKELFDVITSEKDSKYR